jgi:hypothetical protein
MREAIRFDSFRNYPFPIAAVCKKYLQVSPDEMFDKHSVLCDIFESLIKLVAIIALREAHQSIIRDKFPKGLDFLKHPSDGHWVAIIRQLSRENWEDQNSSLSKISNWFIGESASKEIRDCFQELPEIAFQKGYQEIEGIVNSLVTYRNKVWKGHGAFITKDTTLKERVRR